ncbi:unnamed protein product [Meganyctiphanes norvegica]|uniref:Uncharacterized protein n=1 Tax=Meganyctiphanes norvegica TaxID=48144 RepID=A0AAV2QI30_MEGNR
MQHFTNALIMMGFLPNVPSGGALILPYESLQDLAPVSPAFCNLRLRGRRVSGRVVDDSPSSLCGCRPSFGRETVFMSAVQGKHHVGWVQGFAVHGPRGKPI